MPSIVRDLLIYAGACVSLGLAMRSWTNGVLAATAAFAGLRGYAYYRFAADKGGRGHSIAARVVGWAVICFALGALTQSVFLGIGCGSIAFWLVDRVASWLQPPPSSSS